jgi:hypothetical protein
MSDTHKSFIELSLEGQVMLDEIDDYVDAWHDDPENQPLYKYLGMKKSEYSLWLRDPDTLAYIVKSRHDEVPLINVVNDNYEQFRMAARSDNTVKIKRLKKWLQEQGKID